MQDSVDYHPDLCKHILMKMHNIFNQETIKLDPIILLIKCVDHALAKGQTQDLKWVTISE